MATQINLYRSNGEWCYAAFVDGKFDVSDTLGIPDGEPFAGAKAEAAEQFAKWPEPEEITFVLYY